jgi:hypothetical protein
MSILQGGVSGKVQSRELFVAVMIGFGLIRVLYQRVIALPIVVRVLMKLHFNFRALRRSATNSFRMRLCAATVYPFAA